MPPSPSLRLESFAITVRGETKPPSNTKSPPTIGFHSTPKPAPVVPKALPAAASERGQDHALSSAKPIEAVPVQRRCRIRLAEALRKQGIDEHKLAEIYADVMDKLKDKSEDRGVEKLLLDVLKECSRILEEESHPTKSEARIASIPIVVHNVPRPERGPRTGGDNNGST